jgi:hypothetical protein
VNNQFGGVVAFIACDAHIVHQIFIKNRPSLSSAPRLRHRSINHHSMMAAIQREDVLRL